MIDDVKVKIFEKNRLLILENLLHCPDELCGCDLVEKLGLAKNLLSHHLKVLREAGLIEETPCGQRKRYRIIPSQKEYVKQIINLVR